MTTRVILWNNSKYDVTCKACGRTIPLDQPRGKDPNSRDSWCKPCLDANAKDFQIEIPSGGNKKPYDKGQNPHQESGRKLGQCCICGAEAEVAWESNQGEERLFCHGCQMLRTKIYRFKKMGVWPFVREGRITTDDGRRTTNTQDARAGEK